MADFLGDEYVHELLKTPAAVFAPASDATKAEFESKTAAIHVTPTPNDQYDIKIIKEDAAWLSENAAINLVAALRIVVVEFQSRAESHLRTPLSTQDAANLQDAAGISSAQASALMLAPGSAVADAESIMAAFEREPARRQRIFAAYLAERRYYMMCVDYVRSILRYNRLPTYAPVQQDGVEIAKLYRLKLGSQDDRKDFPAQFLAFKVVVDKAIDALASGPISVKDKTLLQDEVLLDWSRTMVTEAIHAISVIFQDLDSAGDVFAQSGVVMGWFKLMREKGFLDFVSKVCHVLALNSTNRPLAIEWSGRSRPAVEDSGRGHHPEDSHSYARNRLVIE